MTRVGLQLWTLREECERDLLGTIERVGALGYDGVELFRLEGLDAAEVRAALDAAGLAACGAHVRLGEDLRAVGETLRSLGTSRAAIAWIDPSELVDADAAVRRVAAAAEAARACGLALGFHNHWSELAPDQAGRTFLDRLRDLPHDLVWLELDLGWIWVAGADPAAELAASAGRCPIVHLKDYADRESRTDVPVGDGAVGYDTLVERAVSSGAEWLVVEQDEPQGDPFAAAARSLAAVRELLP
ncbi:MAG TPA: sugar phosphate isomerase/epimerase [Gaiellaceae bacterium]|jgi:sugar phosphate isomerase/epimerase